MNLSTLLDGAENACEAAERALIKRWETARPLDAIMVRGEVARCDAAIAWAKDQLAEVKA